MSPKPKLDIKILAIDPTAKTVSIEDWHGRRLVASVGDTLRINIHP